MRYPFNPMMLIMLVACLPTESLGQTSSRPSKGGSGYGGSAGGYGGYGEGGGGYPGSGGGSGTPGGMGMGAGYPGGMGGYSEGMYGSPASLAFTIDGKPFQATRVYSFQYTFHSFRPQEINFEGSSGGYGGTAPESGYGGGGYGGGPKNRAMKGGMGMPGGNLAGNIEILLNAYVFDDEIVNDRTRIELVVQQLRQPTGLEKSGAADSYNAMMAAAQRKSEMKEQLARVGMVAFSSLAKKGDKEVARVSESEIDLVSDMICQSIWKEDVVKALVANKGQGELATKNEKLLKQLLAEQYDTQLARQEMEAESIKQRLDQLVDELKRRKLAKDRVVEVQLGRIILDAQGLLNNEK